MNVSMRKPDISSRGPFHAFTVGAAFPQYLQLWTAGFGLEAGSTGTNFCPFHIRPMSSVLLPASFMLLPLMILTALFLANLFWWTVMTCIHTTHETRWWRTQTGFGWKPYARTAACMPSLCTARAFMLL
jgi:hypothetical protein